MRLYVIETSAGERLSNLGYYETDAQARTEAEYAGLQAGDYQIGILDVTVTTSSGTFYVMLDRDGVMMSALCADASIPNGLMDNRYIEGAAPGSIGVYEVECEIGRIEKCAPRFVGGTPEVFDALRRGPAPAGTQS